MRGRSFKDELTSYQASRVGASAATNGVGNRNTADTQHVTSWKDHLDVEKIWSTIQKAARPETPILATEFIQTILEARLSAVMTINRLYGTKGINRRFATPGFYRKWESYVPKLKKQLSKVGKQLPPFEVLDILEAAAFEARTLLWFCFGHGELAAFEPSQKDQNGTRVRKLFAQVIHNYLRLHCGQHNLNEEIAALTEIAFPGRELDESDVINWLKPTTKIARHSK
jgi:hypothetical protein